MELDRVAVRRRGKRRTEGLGLDPCRESSFATDLVSVLNGEDRSSPRLRAVK